MEWIKYKHLKPGNGRAIIRDYFAIWHKIMWKFKIMWKILMVGPTFFYIVCA